MQESFQAALAALGLAVIFIYLILASQFASFTQPVAIMASLPFSLIGVFLALLLTGTTLNIFSIIGFIMLMGLVTKNAILLVDFANRSRRAAAGVLAVGQDDDGVVPARIVGCEGQRRRRSCCGRAACSPRAAHRSTPAAPRRAETGRTRRWAQPRHGRRRVGKNQRPNSSRGPMRSSAAETAAAATPDLVPSGPLEAIDPDVSSTNGPRPRRWAASCADSVPSHSAGGTGPIVGTASGSMPGVVSVGPLANGPIGRRPVRDKPPFARTP